MKIRDIQQYLRGRCPGSSIERIGSDDEPFLETIYGQDQEVDSTIRDVASFASNSEEQLFYEFVQNAFDANADSLCFYFDKDYLIVLNNGEPFYTDPRSKNPRDGQLYNFLAKGKSIKAGDSTKTGEYGQGSKLLYTLIADKSAASNKAQLLKAIKEEKKGPYLVSWKNVEQLNDFRIRKDAWEFCDPHTGENELLIAKILMTYYPVSPGVDMRFFPDSEFRAIRNAFERLIDPKRNINRLSRGTAIIVPLGKGQYEAISARENLNRVKIRLGGFASLTSEKERNFGRHLEHIYVAQEEVEMHSVRSIFLNFSLDDEEFAYQFAFNPVFAKENYVTLFKTLPVLQAKYKLGFIIDSQNFELDSSRQRINDTSKTGQQLAVAFAKLLEKIKEIQSKDKELFDYIYSCLVDSQPGKLDADSQFISTPFYETFTPFIRENIKTDDGSYLPMGQVVMHAEETVEIPLSVLGITDVHWVSPEISKSELKRFGLDLEEYDLKDILLDADGDKLSSWIASLDKEEYLKMHDVFYKIVSESFDECLEELPLFRSNKGKIYSLNEIISDSPVFIFGENDEHKFYDRCPDIEYIIGAVPFLSDDRTENPGTVNIKKVVKNIDFFRKGTARTDVACNILKASLGYDRTKKAVRNNVPILQNLAGEYVPFSDLFYERPEGTTVYDSFCVAGYVPNALGKDIFIRSEEVWDWTFNNFERIKALLDWDKEHKGYLNSLIKVFKDAGEPQDGLELYLDESGVPQNVKMFTIRNAENLRQEEYDLLADFCEKRGYRIVPYPFSKILTTAPFYTEEATMSDVIDDAALVKPTLFDTIIKVYEGILHNYSISETETGEFSIRENKGRNYLSKVRDEKAEAALDSVDFFRIDEEVQRHFTTSTLREFDITTNTGLMKKAIDKLRTGNLFALLPLVKRHNEEISIYFFDRLGDITVDEQISEEDLRWQVIAFALSKVPTEEYYRPRLLSLISHNNQRLPDTIKGNTVSFNDTVYDLYKLVGDVKTENELADSFFSCIPDPDSFRKTVYSNTEETESPDDIYEELHDTYLSVEQLRFCLDYSLAKGCSYKTLEIAPEESLSDALEMIGANGFDGFDEYFSIQGFNKDVQVHADKSLLLPIEVLPEAMSAWLDKDPSVASLLHGLHTESDSYIAIRKSLKDNEVFYGVDGVVLHEDALKRTLEWIQKQGFVIPLRFGDNRFSTLSKLIEKYPKGLSSPRMLKITGNGFSESEEQYLELSFEVLPADARLMAYGSAYDYTHYILKLPQLKTFFSNTPVFLYPPEGNFIVDQNLALRPRLQIRLTAENKDYKEFWNELYTRWKAMKESEGVTIFLSDNPIGTILSIRNKVNGAEVLTIPTKNNLFGYDAEKKTVIIQFPNSNGLTQMKTLEKASKDIIFFKDPFIALQGLYVDMVEEGLDPNEIIGVAGRKASELAQQLGEENVDKISENIDTVKDLVENLSEDQLKMVSENKDKLQNLLEDMAGDDDDESMESKVRKTIGYIGEVIYHKYLDKNGIEHSWDSQEGVGDYDFRIVGNDGKKDVFVDVKTNLYSFKDNAVPFYIHKSQNRFMMEHPDEQFRIVRISLTDIQLKKSYEHIRDYFGAEADLDMNAELKKRCEKIANDYWRSARIDEFDAASPEYGIKIERKFKH